MIETKDLGKQFGDFWAVMGLNINVQPGQVLALLGQNGAGKTTTVRMLTSLLRPTHGTALVAGFDVVSQAGEIRRLTGVLTEQHGLYTRMTGIEYLDFFGKIHRISSQGRTLRINTLLDYFGLATAGQQRIGEYSKGMRQKLALARAMIHEPPVLLLDEPTSAMDPESARLVRDEIARLRSTHRTIVICTHNLSEAEALADIVAIIYKGRILVSGTLEELKREVLGTSEFEARFSIPWASQHLRLPEGVNLIRSEQYTLRFSVENPYTDNPLLVQELVSMQAPLVTFKEVPRTLEHVYLKVMENALSAEERFLYVQ
jgi:ABC-2 type transport system ATP-binding protein